MRQLWQPPTFDSQELTERARMFHVVAWSLMVVVTGVVAIGMAVQPSMIVRGAVTIVFVDTLTIFLLTLSRRGHTRAASTMLVCGLIVLTTSLAPTAGGIRAPAITFNIIVVMTAGLLLGERAGLVTGMVCIAIGLGLVLAERAGMLPEATAQHTPGTFWLMNALIIAIGISLQRLTAATVKAALDRAGAELAERKQAERERETLDHDLGERVKELRLLHAVARLLQTGRPFNRDLLAELVTLIPSAWQYPECCEARIAYEDIEVSTSGWRDSP